MKLCMVFGFEPVCKFIHAPVVMMMMVMQGKRVCCEDSLKQRWRRSRTEAQRIIENFLEVSHSCPYSSRHLKNHRTMRIRIYIELDTRFNSVMDHSTHDFADAPFTIFLQPRTRWWP